MSNVTSFYAQPVPVSQSNMTSHWPWIIVVIILIIAIIALAIWLLVRYNSEGGGNGRLVTIPGASIKSSSTSITGAWGTLNDNEDKVTLYVSTDPISITTDGSVVCNSSNSCQQASGSGSNNQVKIDVKPNTAYNAVLIATGSNTNHYAVYGPRKVFTQETANLSNILFSVKDLNNPNGAVSATATYTESTDVGIFRYGAINANPNDNLSTTNSSPNSFLVKYVTGDNGYVPAGQDDDRRYVLCRNFLATQPLSNRVILAEWTNPTETTQTPVIYAQGADQTNTDNQIPVDHCQWSYNDSPPVGSEGMNGWCLKTTQSTSINNATNTQSLCLGRNGSALSMVTPAEGTVWFNQKVADSVPPPT